MFREFADGEPQEEWPYWFKAKGAPLTLAFRIYHFRPVPAYSYVVLPQEKKK